MVEGHEGAFRVGARPPSEAGLNGEAYRGAECGPGEGLEEDHELHLVAFREVVCSEACPGEGVVRACRTCQLEACRVSSQAAVPVSFQAEEDPHAFEGDLQAEDRFAVVVVPVAVEVAS